MATVSRAANRAQTPATGSVSGTARTGAARRRRLVVGVPVGIALGALLLTGCGAGQITQTDTQVAAVNGASGDAGPIAVRNVELQYPGGTGAYAPGSNASVTLTIVNTGVQADTLTGIVTPAAQSVLIDGSATGTKALPGGFSVSGGRSYDDQASGAPTTTTAEPTTTTETTTPPTTTGKDESTPTTGAVRTGAPGSATPTGAAASSAVQQPGTITVTLVGLKTVNGAPLRAGLTIPITFRFAKFGEVTVYAPIGAPADDQNPDTVIASVPAEGN
jgi:copper(I)-binding protein